MNLIERERLNKIRIFFPSKMTEGTMTKQDRVAYNRLLQEQFKKDFPNRCSVCGHSQIKRVNHPTKCTACKKGFV